MLRTLVAASFVALAAATSHASAQEAAPAPDIAEAEVTELEASLIGDWLGKMGLGDNSYEVILHIQKLENGALRATGESPDTGASGVETLAIVLSEGSVRMEFQGARFVGGWNAASSMWEGYWRNGDEGVPMTLMRREDPLSSDP